MNNKVCYIVLHFLNIELTINCVESILKIMKEDSQILIIDNGSFNGSYEELSDRYSKYKNIGVYKTDENLGFAKGHNYGYKIAKNIANFHYIILCNNDLIFNDLNFEKQLLNKVENTKYDILGPDIVNLNGIHQNPHRLALLTLKEIRRKNLKKFLFLQFLRLKKKIKFLEKVTFLERRFEKTPDMYSYMVNLSSNEIVLQGSCIIIGKRFIENEEKVFYDDTFLYYEEDLLALYCKSKNYSVKIIDDIQVRHLEGGSTKSGIGDDIDKWIFRISNLIKSGKIYEDKIKKQNGRNKIL